MNVALFLNGVYEEVLQEIISSQNTKEAEVFYLQPHRGVAIQLLKTYQPTIFNPIKLFISTTKNLNNISFIADIVGWENKKSLSRSRQLELNNFIKKYQSKEIEIYPEGINLIAIRKLKQLDDPFSISYLTKVSDNQPLRKRTRPGNWSEVKVPPDYLFLDEKILSEDLREKLNEEIEKSKKLNTVERIKRLSKANKVPEKIKILSSGFKRNPDVIVEVLLRANGICENCNEPAPFLRAKDNTPFLEIHHKIFLSDGGEDTVENAIAVCPNCHRRLHFG